MNQQETLRVRREHKKSIVRTRKEKEEGVISEENDKKPRKEKHKEKEG